MAMARLGSGDEAVELFHMLNPINHTRTAGRRRALQGRALRRSPATSTPTPPTPGAGAGRGTPAPRAGCTAPASRASSGSGASGATFEIDPCIPSSWPEYSIAWRFGRTRYEIAVGEPGAPLPRRSREAELDGAPVDSRAIPLVDDGGRHQVRLRLGEPKSRAAAAARLSAVAPG